MTMVMLYPGEIGELECVQQRLADAYNQRRDAIAKEIARRKANEVPLGEGPKDDPQPLQELPPYEADPKLADVDARFVILDAPDLRAHNRRVLAALKRMRDVWEDEIRRDEEAEGFLAARKDFVRKAVRVVKVGDRTFGDDANGLSGDDLAILERNGFIASLYEAASAFQELGPKKA